MKRLFALIVLCLLSAWASADEGMWLFDHAPIQLIRQQYGFVPTQAWLDHVRLGSVRFDNGGSGSFVSADGLAFTNYHVGRSCVQDISTETTDYTKTGFYARTQADERKCPDFQLSLLQAIEDVTLQVQGAATAGLPVAEAGQAQRAKMSQLEAECAKESGLRCEIVTLYAGGMYQLYKYKTYTDVRLVFTPPEQIAFFGGDADNFEYPRYDLDIAFFRAYENGSPAHLANYLRFSRRGVAKDDLVFVSGNPGKTERLLTMAQLNFLRDVQTPFMLEAFNQRHEALREFAAQSPENARIAADDIFGIENAIKAFKGRYAGLTDRHLMDKKQGSEAALRQKVDGDPKMKDSYGGAWDAIAQATEKQRQLYFPYYFVEYAGGFSGQEARLARLLVRITAEKQKPNSQRLLEYSEARLSVLEQQLFSTAPVYKSLDISLLTASLTMMREKLGPDNAVVKQVLNGRTPAQAASDAIENTRLADVGFRRKLYESGAQAVQQSTDPLVVMMREIDPEARRIRKQWDDQVEAVIRENSTKIAKARFAVLGTNSYPDATFTLRLSYGAVKGYEQNGVHIPYTTEIGGAFEHAARHGNQGPYELPKSWLGAKAKLNLRTPMNFVSTADIIGGNSGSPTVNKRGEIVGIVFDGNMQSLPWDFQYDDMQGRSVHVDCRSILESLRKVSHANALTDELMKGHLTTAAHGNAK